MATSEHYAEYRDLRFFIWFLVITAFPMISLTLTVSFVAGSLTVLTAALDTGVGMLLNIVSLVTLGIIMRQNIFDYPYGTGKLENFVGILYGCCIAPVSIVILSSAVRRYSNPPEMIDLGLSQIAMFINFLRTALFCLWIVRIAKKHPVHSPMVHAYRLDYISSTIYEFSMALGLLLGWLASRWGTARTAVMADLVIAALIALYILSNGLKMIYKNFRSLIDLPLPEADQLRIFNALAREFKNYSGVGNVYTHKSGKRDVIQMELYFDDTVTVEEIEQMRLRLEQHLREHFHNLMFHLIPLRTIQDSAPRPAAALSQS